MADYCVQAYEQQGWYFSMFYHVLVIIFYGTGYVQCLPVHIYYSFFGVIALF